jgi:2-amino-4-hydroxy-6-hydroxymethyldihydropteridine diphosphokinase
MAGRSAAPVVAYVGLGSNLGDREGILRAALASLAEIPGVSRIRVSSLRETAPWGEACRGQPPYLNAVAELHTTLPPESLLHAMQSLEARFGRTRAGRWAPRTLDLDLLLYGDRVMAIPGLEVPHPRLTARRFVLEPLVELAPDLVLPDGVAAKARLASLPSDDPA